MRVTVLSMLVPAAAMTLTSVHLPERPTPSLESLLALYA